MYFSTMLYPMASVVANKGFNTGTSANGLHCNVPADFSANGYTRFCGFCYERFPLTLGTCGICLWHFLGFP